MYISFPSPESASRAANKNRMSHDRLQSKDPGGSNEDAVMRNLAMLFPYLVTEDLPVARLGTRDVNPAFDAPVPKPVGEPFTERYP